MISVIQRVTQASVTVDQVEIGKIDDLKGAFFNLGQASFLGNEYTRKWVKDQC